MTDLAGDDRRRRHEWRARLDAQNVGDIPPPAEPQRRADALSSLETFGRLYTPRLFYLPTAEVHAELIRAIDHALRTGEWQAYALPRGSGKTTWGRLALLYAICSGLKRFAVGISATKKKACAQHVRPIRTWMETLPEWGADFPEISAPVRHLRRQAGRARGQHQHGEATYIGWQEDKIVFPRVRCHDGTLSPYAGCVITGTGLDGDEIRGQLHDLPGGDQIRPDFAIADDPQTRKSARSVTQTDTRKTILTTDVAGMAGPDRPLSVLIAGTVICQDDLMDQILDPARHPEFKGIRRPLLIEPPTSPRWDEFHEIGAVQGFAAARDYYRDHQAELDEGVVVYWPERFGGLQAGALSAVHEAMWLKLFRPEFFASECQNDPSPAEEPADEALEVAQIKACIRDDYPPGVVPAWAQGVVAAIDVQSRYLPWLVLAYGPGFRAHVVAYGAHPRQSRSVYTTRNASRTLADAYPQAPKEEGRILQGLLDLTRQLEGPWRIENDESDGYLANLILVDAGWSQHTGIIHEATRARDRALSFKGQPVRAGGSGLETWKRQPGERIGLNWRIRYLRHHRCRHALAETNYWKSAAARAIQAGPSCLSLPRGEHPLLLAEWTAETPILEEKAGARATRWVNDHDLDNHLWDCLCMSYVAASIQGASFDLTEDTPGLTLSDVRQGLARLNRRA